MRACFTRHMGAVPVQCRLARKNAPCGVCVRNLGSVHNSNNSRRADFTSSSCPGDSLPSFFPSALWSILANPCTFTAECLGSHRGLPMSTSPRSPRSCEVNGATTTSDRASVGRGTERTTTGRTFAATPKSTSQTSPRRASVLTECVLPGFPLFFCCDEPVYGGCDRKWQVVS